MIAEEQCHRFPTFWPRLILMSLILLSGQILVSINPCQIAHAQINCIAGPGGPGGISYGGQGGSVGGVGGDCVIGGNKVFSPGGFNQNNGTQGLSQANGGANVL
jgi:hypothetical protein